MAMERVECVVVGAGVVGLATARALALAGREVIILEANGLIGSETSARSSEVIHAGIYYPAGSLMAHFCVEGRRALYAYCRERGVPHRNCGKLIVATNEKELAQLPAIAARAAANGVDDLTPISAAEAIALEPALSTTGALLSPSSGIVDSHAYMQALLSDAEAGGAVLALKSPLLRAAASDRGFILHVGGVEPMRLACRTLVNSAGLHAPAVARAIDGMPAGLVPVEYYAKGSYFSLVGRAPFERLIYPVPVKGGLGTHLTLDMAGQARFGPDVEWVDAIDYSIDPQRAELFYQGIRRYFPGLADGFLLPAYSGIRPKIVPPAVAVQDFAIQGPDQHGLKGLVNLFGIELPGLTSSLAIGDHVAGVAGRSRRRNSK